MLSPDGDTPPLRFRPMNERRPPLNGILAGPIDGPEREAATYPAVAARSGLRVLHRSSGFAGDLVALDDKEVVLRGQTGLVRRFPNDAGAFALDGTAVRLVAPATQDVPPAHLAHARVSTTDAHRIRQPRRRRRGARVARRRGSWWKECTTPS